MNKVDVNLSTKLQRNYLFFFNVSTDYLLGKTDFPEPDSDIDLDTAIDNSVAFDGTPITDDDREIIKNYLKDYFANKK